MTDQEEFEKWYSNNYNRLPWMIRQEQAWESWQACAEQKNAVIEAKDYLLQRYKEKEAFHLTQLEQQAKELKALRKVLTEIVEGGYFEVYITYGWGITDKSGNPTKLLTGE